ncbi:18 kDa seed maturation protein-like [Citrus clementina]|uniref:18 kDa seed maturation protein-like n=1 Tax=Citrus clementina TaxID=85681 RepID=UPI000CECF0B8|nr:18 kDa seed maturation protein-like [Citrus x clementina]
MALQPHHSVREKAERMKRSDPAEKEAVTREKEERDKQAQWNKKEAHFHNEEAERVAQSGGGGAHPGYKTWGSHSQARDDSNATATAPAPATGTEGRYTPATMGVGHATVAGDSRQPRGPVRSDAPRFT